MVDHGKKILKPNGRWWGTMIDWRGCFCCPNNHCDYKVMFKRPNKLKFDRYKRWIFYGAGGFYLKCIARKHAACISETEGDVFYYGAQLRELKFNRVWTLMLLAKLLGLIHPSNHQQSQGMLFYLKWEVGNPGTISEKL